MGLGATVSIWREAHAACPLCLTPPAITEVVKCEHERAVHLFVDSLVNQDKPSFAFQCTDSNRFKKGICLSCRKNRCNSIGYNAKKTRSKRNSKMYLKTRAGMPFRGNPPSPRHPEGGPSFFPFFSVACCGQDTSQPREMGPARGKCRSLPTTLCVPWGSSSMKISGGDPFHDVQRPSLIAVSIS